MHSRARTRLLATSVLLLTTAVVGCTDLTVAPKSTVTSANIFNDPNSYKEYLAKLYAGLQATGQVGPYGNKDIQAISDEGFSGYLRLWWQMEELPTDEALIGWGDGSLQELNTQVWGETNPFLGGMYSRVFFQVSLANEFLRQTTDAALASRGVSGQLAADIKTYRAEARFLRAMAYWNGMDLFGNIPLVKEDFAVGGAPPKQATRAEIFAFVESELQAIKPDLPAPGPSTYGRANAVAADMMLAEIYLNAKVYTGTDRSSDALAAALRVINSDAYSLDPVYRNMFLADNNKSPEIIFAIPSDGVHQQSYGGMTTIIHASVGGSMNAAEFGLNGGWWGLRTRPEFVALFGGANTADTRSGLLWADGQNLDIASIGNFNDGYAAPKYRNVTSTGQPGSNAEFVDVDFPVFRLAEAYLIYAEAVLRGGGGDRATAVSYINLLRERAYGDNSGNITDADLTLQFILDERGRELWWEAKRRTDLIRFDQFTANKIWEWKGNVQPGKITDPKYNLYPLPGAERVANPNLQQNPGY
jgi:hypothetical protein